MTRKNQINIRRKVLKLSAVFFISGSLFASCKKETTTIGEGLEGSSLNTSFTDTFTLKTYTEYTDSIETDETSVSLLGAYSDPVFGNVDCGIVTQMRLSSVAPEFGNTGTLTMDSVVLTLRYTSINYYGNIQPMTFEVYEITDDLVRTDKEYYTFNSPTTTGSNLVLSGSETITPNIVAEQVVGDDTLPAHLRIHLDPSFGMAMVAANDAGQMNTDDGFVSFFNGLNIKVNSASIPEGQGTVLYTVMENSVSGVTMYFKDNGTPKTYDFEFNSSAARYNDIKYDRTGTDVEASLLDLTKGEQAFYMQGSALRAVIEIPNLMDFNYDSLGNWDPKIINKAELILPVQDFTSDVFDVSSKLFIAKIVDDKLSESTLDYQGGSSLLTVAYNDDKKEFRFYVTRELQAMLSGDRDFNGFRIYSPSFFGSTIERIVFNGSKTTFKEKPRLEITYTNY
ncbi:MAG: DUF4270 family protein [Crocinitomicaceae bacterium]|nr:DUF4270 family protein [Crocinitomicaceae bacterium]